MCIPKACIFIPSASYRQDASFSLSPQHSPRNTTCWALHSGPIQRGQDIDCDYQQDRDGNSARDKAGVKQARSKEALDVEKAQAFD